jgi:hypothetical protein
MNKKTIGFVCCAFLLGIICGALGYFAYINRIEQNYQEFITNGHFESGLTLYWLLKYNKIEKAKKRIAEEIEFNQKKMKEKFNSEPKIPEYLDSCIKNSIQFRDTGVEFTTYPYEDKKSNLGNKKQNGNYE